MATRSLHSTAPRIGHVTSGSPAPFLKKNIAMALVAIGGDNPDYAPGTELAVEIRNQLVKAQVVPLPFYKRPKK